MVLKLKRISIFILLITLSFPLFGQDLANQNSYSGGIYNISNGAILEGSSHVGGIQPHYIIDLNAHGPMEDFLSYSRSLKHLKPEQRVEKVMEYIQNHLPDRRYDSPSYLASLEKYRELGEPIPLSEYLKNGSGVCRENSLLTHIGLREAGVESRYIYVKAQVLSYGQKNIEDHAFVLIEKEGQVFTVDSYNSSFHDVKFSELLKEEGFKRNDGQILSIRKINEYPKIYLPKTSRLASSHPGDMCLSLFSINSTFENKIMKNILNSSIKSDSKKGLWSLIRGTLLP